METPPKKRSRHENSAAEDNMARMYIPVTLKGNLGERHKYLNSLINKAYNSDKPFTIYEGAEESSPVDRLFKIDLASKLRNVDFIIKNLKDRDMLYVTRALKCIWLLEPQYADIINPVYLEDILYKDMTTTAINKMRHWISLHLKDQIRCQDFYTYYKLKIFGYSIHFLSRSNKEFIKDEVPNILDKITPQYMKLIGETYPMVLQNFIDGFHNSGILKRYLKNQLAYYVNSNHLLKLEPNLYLDYIEKYFNKDLFKRLSPNATQFVMRCHKERFQKKPELYTSVLLDVKTVAKNLNNEEIKSLLTQLARADYLRSWFTYKNVAPLMKAIDFKERSEFKKKIFVDKTFGDKVEKWPYPIPEPPKLKPESVAFRDKKYNPRDYHPMFPVMRECCLRSNYLKSSLQDNSLDVIFARYRFMSFERTFFDLRKKIMAEGVLKKRQDMLLVLVSKTGGRVEHLEQLLQFLIKKQTNEAKSLQATVVRSLVKRTAIWRVPEATWQLFITYARGVGVDGETSKANCSEALHAVVIRNMIFGVQISPKILKAFTENISTFTEYTLSGKEKCIMSKELPKYLIMAAEEEIDIDRRASILNSVLDVIESYRISVDDCPDFIFAVKRLQSSSLSTATSILKRMFKARIARRTLFHEQFEINQTDESYLNALRHNLDILIDEKHFQELVKAHKLHHDKFLQKLAIYFTEDNGLATQYLAITKSNLHVNSARAMAILSGNQLLSLLDDIDNDKGQRRISSRLRANAHLSKPQLDLNKFSWKKAGSKAVSNQVIKLSHNEANEVLGELLKCRRTCKLALVISARLKNEVDTFGKVSQRYPLMAIKSAFSYFKHNVNNDETVNASSGVASIIKPLLPTFNLTLSSRNKLCVSLAFLRFIPTGVKKELSPVIFGLIQKNEPKLINVTLCAIERFLPDVSEDFIYNIGKEFFNGPFSSSKLADPENYHMMKSTGLHIRVLVKFILLSTNERDQQRKVKEIAMPFFNNLATYWTEDVTAKKNLIRYLLKFISSLIFNKAIFDAKYVDCTPLFELAEAWIQKYLPIEIYFVVHMRLKMTSLYYKTIKECVGQYPDVFADVAQRETTGVEIVGTALGERISKMMNENVFGSHLLLPLYAKVIVRFVNALFIRHYIGNVKRDLMPYILKELVLQKDNNSQMLAIFCYKTIKNHFHEDDQELKAIFKDNMNDVTEILLHKLIT